MINLDASSFETTIHGNVPVLVDFWAPWCGPCQSIAPILEELAGELKGKVNICKLNVDDHSDLAAKYDVRSIPTLLLFKNGLPVERIVGLVNKSQIKEKIAAHSK